MNEEIDFDSIQVPELFENELEILNARQKLREMVIHEKKEEIDSTYGFFSDLDSEITQLKNYEKKVKQTIKRMEEILQKSQDMLKAEIRDIGFSEIKGNSFAFHIHDSAGKLVIDNEGVIPEKYHKEVLTKVIDNARIKESLLNGFEVPGARIEKSIVLNKKVLNDEKKQTFHGATIERAVEQV